MNALEIKNLTKSYPDFTLDNLNLTLPSGCIMGLVGENGAGKSTTIKLILDMIHKDSGSITILGRDNGDNIKLTKEDIGVVLDEVGIPECLTVNQVGKVMKHACVLHTAPVHIQTGRGKRKDCLLCDDRFCMRCKCFGSQFLQESAWDRNQTQLGVGNTCCRWSRSICTFLAYGYHFL